MNIFEYNTVAVSDSRKQVIDFTRFSITLTVDPKGLPEDFKIFKIRYFKKMRYYRLEKGEFREIRWISESVRL